LLDEYAARLDFSYKLKSGVTIVAGVRYSTLGAETRALRSVATPARNELLPYLQNTNANSFLVEIPGNFPRVFVSAIPDFNFVRNRALQAQTDPTQFGGLFPNQARDYTLSEDTIAGYFDFNAEAEMLGMPTKINAGVRVESTDLWVDSFLQTATSLALRNNTNSYTNILPSANFTFNVTDDFLVRVSASQTMQSAGVAELAPINFVNPTNLTATGGNAELRPTISSQVDISFEYHTGRTALISGALFSKDVQNFVANQTVLETFPGFESLGPIPSTKPGNVASAEVRGFEIGVQQFLDFLPSPFDGLGFIANYTYSDAVDSNGFPLVGVSKNSYNLIGLYEKGPFSARIAYNFRDEAVFEFTEGRPSFVGERSQLDAEIGFDLTDRISLQLQAQNLMPEDSATVEYSLIGPVALNSYALSERRFSIGARMKF
jgi:iron complex outermembrane recepter protein